LDLFYGNKNCNATNVVFLMKFLFQNSKNFNFNFFLFTNESKFFHIFLLLSSLLIILSHSTNTSFKWIESIFCRRVNRIITVNFTLSLVHSIETQVLECRKLEEKSENLEIWKMENLKKMVDIVIRSETVFFASPQLFMLLYQGYPRMNLFLSKSWKNM
jgi:hypothetical protein